MTSSAEARVPYPRRIFCNRNLRLDKVRFVGFDMDYTLALYTEAMEHLQAEMVLKRLVERDGYPRELMRAQYQPGFAIRGLGVDKLHGNVFKMDQHRFVGRVWHGGRPLDRDIRRETYTNRKITPGDESIVMVDTLFALPEISLYGQVIDYFDGLPEDSERPSYSDIWRDLRHAMDSLHRDGTLKARIVSDIPAYIHRDPDLSEMLHRFRSSGKKLFILTNSEASYTEAVMSYLLDDVHAAYPSWRDYFDIVSTSAVKPNFFTGDTPFVEVLADGTLSDEPVTALRRGHIYQSGNVAELHALTGMLGDDVLYVGDHIYGDILRSKRSTSWRTAMIIPEMERELDNVALHGPELDELGDLEDARFRLNLERAGQALDGIRNGELKGEIKRIGQRIVDLERGIADAFNPAWGPLFRDRAELSAFGAQVEDYACVYTSRASNFRLYSPFWYYRSPRDRMAHELER